MSTYSLPSTSHVWLPSERVAKSAIVVPKVVEVFRTSEAQLPILTQLLIAGSDFMRQYGLWLVIGLVAAGFLFTRWLRVESNRRRWHQFLLRIPLIGKVVRGSNTARFARTFSTLTASTVPVQ